MSIHSRRRRSRHALLSVAVAALLSGSFGLTAILANAQAASATTGDFTIPVGGTLTISGAAFSACDALAYGYELTPGAEVQLVATQPGGEPCPYSDPVAGTTIGPFTSVTTVTIYLTDYHGDDTFFSDAAEADSHALISGSGPYTVDIMDDFVGGCSTDCQRIPKAPGGGNLTLTVTLTPPPLTASPVTVGPATTSIPLMNVRVATFVDPDRAATYSASITWGDGTTSAADPIALPSGGMYTVTGSHTYSPHGTTASQVMVTITSSDGGSAMVTDNYVTISDAVITCTTSPCTGTLLSQTLTAQASTSSTGTGYLFLSSDPNSGTSGVSCGDNFRHAPRVIEETNTFSAGSGSITTTDTFLNKNGIPGKGLEGLLYAICFSSSNRFIDAFGKPTVRGLLPICNPFKPGPGPCVNWILPGAGGTIVEKVTYPAGDPKYG